MSLTHIQMSYAAAAAAAAASAANGTHPSAVGHSSLVFPSQHHHPLMPTFGHLNPNHHDLAAAAALQYHQQTQQNLSYLSYQQQQQRFNQPVSNNPVSYGGMSSVLSSTNAVNSNGNSNYLNGLSLTGTSNGVASSATGATNSGGGMQQQSRPPANFAIQVTEPSLIKRHKRESFNQNIL